MRKCPVCEKTFDDSMRFCQTDGTSLLDFVEETPDDPLKTTVVQKDELASVIPTEDPFRSSSQDAQPKDDTGDLLQLPEDFDPMKTVVSREEAKIDLNLNEPQDEPVSPPSSPFDTPASPFDSKQEDAPGDFTAPEPPKFSEPSLSPPNFGDMSAPQSFEEKQSSDEPPPTAIYMPQSNPFSSEPAAPNESSGSSPFEKPLDSPIPSPFSDPPKPSYENPPVAPYKEPEPVFSNQQDNPFNTPPSIGNSPFDQQNQGFNQPAQQSDWNPPPAPVSNWQDQGLGANTPFQPPVSGVGQDQTMAIVSLVCGVASFVVCPLTAPVALITGYMARKKAQENPQQFGGEGLALAGMIIGGIITVLVVLVILLYVLIIFGAIASSNF